MKQNPFVRPGAEKDCIQKGQRYIQYIILFAKIQSIYVIQKGQRARKKKEPKQYIDTNAPWVTPPWWKNIAVTDVSVGSLEKRGSPRWYIRTKKKYGGVQLHLHTPMFVGKPGARFIEGFSGYFDSKEEAIP